MSLISRSIEVEVPVSTAYKQWTQFEQFPQFMEGVERVEQLDDKRLYWRAELSGARREWHAEIVEQVPDQRIAWRSTSGAKNAGTVLFKPLGPRRCRIELQLEYEPESAAETIGDWLGVVSSRVDGDLQRFRDFIEHRGRETGAWRGVV